MQALAIAVLVGVAVYYMWRNHEDKAAQRKAE